MPSINLYVHKDLNSQTIKVWESFFQQHLPSWKLYLKFAEDILKGKPDHILFPGGSGSAFSKRLGQNKRDEIVHWISEGGSYIGVCAGAYLAASHLCITPLKIPDRAWERGLHDVILEKDGQTITVNYHNGPIFDDTDDVEVWARFRSNFLAEGGFFPMEGSPAITHNKFGRGNVTLFSPHLEKSEEHVQSELANLFEYIDQIKVNANEAHKNI